MRLGYFVVFCLLLFVSWSSYGQPFGNCRYTYFKNGKKATSQCYDANDHWGQARAYNGKGEVIYEKDLRKIAGHSSVQFSFYENGAVKKAEYSSAPDAGIQWYRTFTEFAPDGTITSEVHQNYDDGPGTTAPFRRQEYVAPPTTTTNPTPAPCKPAPTTVACAVIYSSEFWFINTTPYSVVVTATHKHRKNEMSSLTLRPRQSAKGGQVLQAQFFDDPAKQYDFSVRAVRPGNKTKFILLPSDKKPEQTSTENKRYYFDIRRII